MDNENNSSPSELELLKGELKWEKHKLRYRRVLRSTVYTLLVASAIAVLVAVVFLPVMQIYGSSMTPTLYEGEIVVSLKGSSFEQGDVIGMYYGSKLLVKRVVAYTGQWVDIDESGNVYVDGVMLDEPYISEKAFGECNIQLPYQVPENCVFVMGDHRATSIDSRNTAVGCINVEDIVGKIVCRVWPLSEFGPID